MSMWWNFFFLYGNFVYVGVFFLWEFFHQWEWHIFSLYVFFPPCGGCFFSFGFSFGGLALFATIFARAHVPYLNLEILMQERKVL